ncbi:MAG: DUF3800 domain-containing protein [Anaerolineales bacterium]|nr:DUF3800 domain-containing protein [Anaerolineales bacterium]
MKFIYIDESGERDHTDVFVMCGLMVDAYKLRKKTENFDRKLEALFARHPGARADLKTSRFINGKGAWREIDAQERKDLLTEICQLAVANGGKIFGYGLSFQAFDAATREGHGQPCANNYWLASAMFTSCLLQKKMQGVSNSKGLTVVIMDDNKVEMPALSDALYIGDPWYDGLYQIQKRRRGHLIWVERTEANRFDHIVNTAFAIKSDHSSLIQVADALSYVYRRHLELTNAVEAWVGEQVYISDLVALLEPNREKLGRCHDEPCLRFFLAAKHPEWQL